MRDLKRISNVTYKKGNKTRYIIWSVVLVCLAASFAACFITASKGISAAIPEGYKFSVTDKYSEGSHLRTTYYVYDDCIMVEDESFEPDLVNRTVKVYDNVNTAPLTFDSEDTDELCELGVCHQVPKVLIAIKRLISSLPGRDYIGL